MGSSFKDLDASSSKVKTVRTLDKRFSIYFVFKIRFKKIKGKNYSPTVYNYTENRVHISLTAEVQTCSNSKYKYVQIEYTSIQLLDVQKKSASKPIDMGSSFKDLDARSSKVKTVRNLDKQFSRYFVFKLRFKI